MPHSRFPKLPSLFLSCTAASQNYTALSQNYTLRFYPAQSDTKITQPVRTLLSRFPKLHSRFLYCTAGSQNYTALSQNYTLRFYPTQPVPKITQPVRIAHSMFPNLNNLFPKVWDLKIFSLNSSPSYIYNFKIDPLCPDH